MSVFFSDQESHVYVKVLILYFRNSIKHFKLEIIILELFRIHNKRGTSFYWSACHDKRKVVVHAATEFLCQCRLALEGLISHSPSTLTGFSWPLVCWTLHLNVQIEGS